jgi:Hint module
MPAIYPFHTSSPSLRNGQSPSNNLIPTPSLSPVDKQVPVESITPTPEPSPSIYCFSGKSKVLLQNVGWVMIHHINLGDRVLVRQGIYEEVYSFGHHNQNASGYFIQIYSKASKEPIEISSHHLILLRENRWVPASAIRIGDTLTTGEGNQVVVNRIVHKVRSGLFAPFTKSGSIVVNNIVASNFISLQESEYLTIGGLETPFSYQWLALNFETFHRMSCRLYSCRREKYSYDGISYWVYVPFKLSDFFLSLHPIVTTIFFLPILFLFGAVYIFTFPIRYLLPFIVCTVIISKTISRKKILEELNVSVHDKI